MRPVAASAAAPSLALRVSQLVAFLVPGLALSVSSGYSIGATVLALAALIFMRQWWRERWDSRAVWLGGILAAMGLLWALSFDGWSLTSGSDQLLKYLLAALGLGFLQRFAPKVRPLGWGMLAGALGAGLVAVYQTGWQQMHRATGFTNAIQFSGIALVLALGCCFGVLLLWRSLAAWQRLLGLVCCLFGLLAVVLSDTRGSWIVLPVVLIVGAVQLWRCGLRKPVSMGLVAAVIGVGSLVALKGPEMAERYHTAVQEVTLYQEQGQAHTSVGQRLAHWRLAWQMGLDKPVLGWGVRGYETEKARRVQAGQADAFVQQFSHAHNELMDMFAKRGLLGVVLLLAFYLVPLAIFWPTRRRMQRCPGVPMDRQILYLRMLGILLPLCYAGFGVTQVFFAHNSGHMFYTFMLVVLLGALIGREHALRVMCAPPKA
ncbi:MAG: O-antigen ligase family protein [Comamonas sp.]